MMKRNSLRAALSYISSKIILKCGLTGLEDNRYKVICHGFGGTAISLGEILGCKLMVGTTPIIWSFNVKGHRMVIGANFWEHFQVQLAFSVRVKEKCALFINQNNDVLAEEVKNMMKNVNHSAYLSRRYDRTRKTITVSLEGSESIALRVQLNGQPVEALIDTGNKKENVIPEAMVAKFGLENRIDSSKKTIGIGVGGPVSLVGLISDCVLKFGKHASYIKLKVVPDTALHINLGMEFLKKLNATINYKTQQLEFSKDKIQYSHPVYPLTNVELINSAEKLEIDKKKHQKENTGNICEKSN